jgi:hypothetical protein
MEYGRWIVECPALSKGTGWSGDYLKNNFIKDKEMKILNKPRIMKIILTSTLSIGLLAMAAIPVQAYSLLGYTWDDVDPLYSFIPNPYAMVYQDAFRHGCNDWSNYTDEVDIQPIYTGADDCDIYAWVANDSGVGWDGICTITCSGSEITYASCALNHFYASAYSADKKQSVFAHEVGHALGLSDVYSGAVLMNYSTPQRYDTYGVYRPQTDDIDGVNAMY